jgi:hypothetical protein
MTKNEDICILGSDSNCSCTCSAKAFTRAGMVVNGRIGGTTNEPIISTHTTKIRLLEA